MSASSKDVDVFPLSAANFDEVIVKRKISTCASFEELRVSMQEGRTLPEIGGASGEGQNQDGVSNGGGSGAVAAVGNPMEMVHALSQSIPEELQESYKQLVGRLTELDDLNKMPREWTSKNFKKMLIGPANTRQVVAFKENANEPGRINEMPTSMDALLSKQMSELASDLDALTTRLACSWREGVSFDMKARALSGDIVFQTRLRADSLVRGTAACANLHRYGNDNFMDFVELNCLQPLHIELQEKRVEAVFQKLQQDGLVVDDALCTGSFCPAGRLSGRCRRPHNLPGEKRPVGSLLSGKVECDPPEVPPDRDRCPYDVLRENNATPLSSENSQDGKGRSRSIVLSTFRARASDHFQLQNEESELFDLRLRPCREGSKSELSFFTQARDASFLQDLPIRTPILGIPSRTRRGFEKGIVALIDGRGRTIPEKISDRGIFCRKINASRRGVDLTVDSVQDVVFRARGMEWTFDCAEKRDAVYDVIVSVAGLLLDANKSSAITAAVTEQNPERFSDKIMELLDYDNKDRLRYVIDAGPHSLMVTNATKFRETVDFVNSAEYLEEHKLTDDEEAKKRLTYELYVSLGFVQQPAEE